MDLAKVCVNLVWGFVIFWFKEFSGAHEIELKELARKYPRRDVDFSPDIPKRDAVVSAFKARPLNLGPAIRLLTFCYRARGSHMVRKLGLYLLDLSSFLLERNAMGADEFHPISQEGTNLTTGGGIGYTVIDAIDTMKLMGLEAEFSRARTWIETKLDFNQDGNYSTFEVSVS